ncbi:DUF2971 domain-containing protein [Pseudomonas sp. MF7453]|uniref:DUF2971 domain-containing protein n=1 Tax=Pseudomonas sp. MF7453 TaxID=2797539 RepID=UPI0018E7C7FF|nr:DUF2971 domain-containing protein [Pseudomonas sp. MF7453]MBJ2219621.1 DUF2971 domain-containing protein [Pseudomonas sp. MF7453]
MSREWIDELMQLIGTRSMSLERISAAQSLKFDHFPNSLFKFREVNDYSLNNLESSTLHLTFASNFNDPYDSAVDFDPSFGVSHVESLLNHVEEISEADRQNILTAKDPMLEMLRYIPAQMNESELSKREIEAICEVLRMSHAKLAVDMVSQMNTRLQNSYKICSLTERLNSLPLWAHYAKNHTGFAMEYDFKGLSPKNLLGLSLWPVIYSGVFNASDVLRGEIPRKNFNNLFGLVAALHKSPDWAYEEEWRLVLVDGPEYPARNLIAPLKAVYLGSKISEKDEERVVCAARAAGVPVLRMRLVPHKFSMEAVSAGL